MDTKIDKPTKEGQSAVLRSGDLFGVTLQWHKGPAEGGEGTAGKDEETGAPLFWNGDRLLLIIETNKGREIAVVDIDCDDEYWRVTDASSGEIYDAWGPECWSWWAKLDKSSLPPLPNASDEPRPLGAVGSGRLFDGPKIDVK